MSALQSNVCSRRPVAPKRRPEKENNMNANTKPLAGEPTHKLAAKPRKAARPPRTANKVAKLVCRYCGSDDLAPSFKKRRDARCRACFKKRYGSAAGHKKAARSGKAKAAK
jgi:hypothetical protein